MSIASRITEMETHISNAYTSIDNLGIDISNTNKNIYNISTLLDTFYESLPKVSGIGASLSLSPSMVGKIKLNEIQGNTLQNGTPTPSSPVPIESVTGLQNVDICGKNLFDKNKCELVGGVSFNNTENNVYTITSGTTRNFVIIQVKPNTIYTISVNGSRAYLGELKTKTTEAGNGSNSWVNSEKTFTTTSRTNYIGLLIETADLTNFTMQVEQSSTATDYEPYKGNTYEVNLGKNLFKTPVDIITGNGTGITATYNDDGSITFNGTSSGGVVAFRSRIITSKYHTLSYTSNQTSNNVIIRTRAYSDNLADFTAIQDGMNATTTSKSVTSNKSIGCVEIDIASGTTLNNFNIKVQLELGETATSFSPYFPPIELNDEDSIKKSTGKNLCFNITKPANANLKFFVSKSLSKTFTISFTTNEALSNNSLYLEIDGTSYGNIGGITASANTRVEKTYTLSDTDYQAIQNGTNIDLLLYKNNANFNIPDDGMVENNSTASPYEPYGKVWYTTENIQNWSTDSPNVFLINGSDGDAQSSPDGLFQIFTSNLFTNFRNETMLSSKFKYHYDSRINNNINANTYLTDNTFCIRQGTNDRVYFKSSDLANKSKTDVLSTLNSLDLSYVLSTPTYTIITNTELINQLESLNNAKSEDGTTNINVTSEDLSMILNVGVLKGE